MSDDAAARGWAPSASSACTRRSGDPWDYARAPTSARSTRTRSLRCRRARSGACLEVGCSIGVFTELLGAALPTARRDRLLRARAGARRRPPGRRAATSSCVQASFPEQAPAGPLGCDGVLGGPLLPRRAALARAMRWLEQQLERRRERRRGQLARARGATEPLRGDEVHDLLAAELGALARARRAPSRLPARPLRRRCAAERIVIVGAGAGRARDGARLPRARRPGIGDARRRASRSCPTGARR